MEENGIVKSLINTLPKKHRVIAVLIFLSVGFVAWLYLKNKPTSNTSLNGDNIRIENSQIGDGNTMTNNN